MCAAMIHAHASTSLSFYLKQENKREYTNTIMKNKEKLSRVPGSHEWL
jgi:hypothetical protein